MLAVARVAGETAPLLFTAFGNRFWHQGLDQPIASLPLQIYTYAISPYDDWHRQAWAGGAGPAHAGLRSRAWPPGCATRGRVRRSDEA